MPIESIAPTNEDWLAMCMASESNEPHEWLYIGWVVRNRGNNLTPYDKIILAPQQFSYFNQFYSEKDHNEIFKLAKAGYAGGLYLSALPCARRVVSAGLWEAPFGQKVRHYFSPVSMRPKGSEPAWAKTAERQFTPSGVDPRRFVFCEGVP